MIVFQTHVDNPELAPPLKILNLITSFALEDNIHRFWWWRLPFSSLQTFRIEKSARKNFQINGDAGS